MLLPLSGILRVNNGLKTSVKISVAECKTSYLFFGILRRDITIYEHIVTARIIKRTGDTCRIFNLINMSSTKKYLRIFCLSEGHERPPKKLCILFLFAV